MKLAIYQTPENTAVYPLHRHDHWEIVLYLQGIGRMRTNQGDFAFHEGSIMAIPPGVMHGSASDAPFRNISIGGQFGHLFLSKTVITGEDNAVRKGLRLATLLYDTCRTEDAYTDHLMNAYLLYVLRACRDHRPANDAVEQIIAQIREHACEIDFRVGDLLRTSGYAEDYIRQLFRQMTGVHPTRYVLRERMAQAKRLMDLYGEEIALSQVAEKCGYADYVAFSKAFRQETGESPSQYRKKTQPR